MSFIRGKNVLLEYLADDSVDWVPFLCAKSCEIALTQSLLKVTDTVNGKFPAFIPESVSGTMTTSGLIKYDIDTVDPIDLILQQKKLRVRFTINDENGNRVKYLQSEGFITGLNMSAGVFALAEQGITIQLSGLIEKAP